DSLRRLGGVAVDLLDMSAVLVDDMTAVLIAGVIAFDFGRSAMRTREFIGGCDVLARLGRQRRMGLMIVPVRNAAVFAGLGIHRPLARRSARLGFRFRFGLRLGF